MTMQELTRYEVAAARVHADRRRVTVKAIDEECRAHDGVGCSPREALPLVRLDRREADGRIGSVVTELRRELSTLDPWMRSEAVRLVRRLMKESAS